MRAAILVSLLLASLAAGCAGGDAPTPGTSSPVPAAPVEALNKTVDFSDDPTGADRAFPFSVTAGSGNVTMRVSFAPSAPATPIVNLDVRLLDPGGKAVGEGPGSCNLASGAMTAPSTCERVAPATAGEWKVVASGSGAATARIVVLLGRSPTPTS